MAPATAIWVRRSAILTVVVIAVERLRAMVSAPSTDFDDAYMFLRYAHNLLAGFGLRWNRGEAPVYGATSLPHVLVVALVRRLAPRLDDAAVLQTASGAAAILFVVALVLTCARFARHPVLRRRGWIWAALLLPPLAYAEPFTFHAQTGMDTMLAALANTALVYAALALAEAPSRARAFGAALAAYAAYLVRPDSAIYAAGIPALCLAVTGPRGARRRPLIAFVAALAALVAIDLLVKQRWLGTPWPLGAYAKRPWYYGGFAGEFTWNPFWFLRVFFAGAAPFIAALVLFTTRRSAGLAAALLAPVTVTIVALFGVNQIMGHLGRFYFPALPFVVVAAALIFDRRLVQTVGAGEGSAGAPAPMSVATSATLRGPLARLAGAALLLLVGERVLTVAGARYDARAATQALAPLDGYTVPAALPLPQLDSWTSSQQMALFARDAPAGTRFAMSEHGLVGAAAPDAVIIDVLGLHDREFARHGFRAAELWRRAPEVIWMPHPDHTQMVRDILDSAELWDHYDFFPDAFSYGVALRRDGPRAAALEALFEAHWQAIYPGYAVLDGYRAARAPAR